MMRECLRGTEPAGHMIRSLCLRLGYPDQTVTEHEGESGSRGLGVTFVVEYNGLWRCAVLIARLGRPIHCHVLNR
jgi:hypothetical protein